MRKEKPIKANNSVNEINEQEEDVNAFNYNNKGNFKNNYRGNQQNARGRGGYQPPARVGHKGPKHTQTQTVYIYIVQLDLLYNLTHVRNAFKGPLLDWFDSLKSISVDIRNWTQIQTGF